jgi:hypothetical protein
MILSFSPSCLLLFFSFFGNASAQALRKGHDQSSIIIAGQQKVSVYVCSLR